MLEKLFGLKENSTSLRRELIAGFTNFMTISYIIFVQPNFLSAAGMNAGAVLVATCVSSALATFLMAFLTNYPVVLAPGMGLNAYFAFEICSSRGLGLPWQEGLGIVFIAGMLFLILSFVGIREAIMNALPPSLQNAIAIGIGLFIAFIGLQMSGIITKDPATFITRGALDSKPVLLSLFGIAVTLGLIARKVKGAILIGIFASAIASLIFGVASYEGIAKPPPDPGPTFFKLDLSFLLNILDRLELIPVIFVFFAIDMFDSIGTLTAIGYRAELLEEGKLTKARGALLTDAAGTVGGALLGTSTVTCYIESATGIAEGGRTGLTAVFTGIFMLLALFFEPLVKIIGGGYPINPIIAPALIVVGGLMLRNVSQIDWEDITESIPAFLTMIMMPLSFSITDGIGFGLISLAFLKLVTGRRKEVHPVIYYFALFFIACYIGDL